MSETRKIAAILVADVVGYTRLAGADEDRTLSRLRGLWSDLIDPAIAAHHGRIVKRTGDGAIVEFRSVVDAVRCAIEVQSAMAERNASMRRGASSNPTSPSTPSSRSNISAPPRRATTPSISRSASASSKGYGSPACRRDERNPPHSFPSQRWGRWRGAPDGVRKAGMRR